MKAITTKRLPATNARAARIRAFDLDGNSFTVVPDQELAEESHLYAAVCLCKKMGWKGKLIGGSVKGGMVWVFVPKKGEK